MNQRFLRIIIALFAVFSLFLVGEVKADTGDNVLGWAWSENIGWISFNCNNPELLEPRCTHNYGVNIKEDGTFEGYAWSENIGWISFNSTDLVGCPSGSCEAKVDLITGQVSGWARAYRPIETEGQTLGGWTGWIKFDHGQPNQVYIDENGAFHGYAWGGGGQSRESAVIGWIDFDAVETIFSFVQPPNTPTGLSDSWNHCSYKGKSLPGLSWSEFSHPDDKSQAGYEIQIGKSSDLPKDPPGQGEWREVSTTAGNSYTPSHRIEEWAGWMDWNRNYWWAVRVEDSDGNWSDWSSVKRMDEGSPLHAYPWPDFTWQPEGPSQQETVEFNPDISESFGGAAISSYLWAVTKGEYEFVDDTDEHSQYPSLQFSTTDNAVRLRITDSDGYSCSCAPKEIKAYLPLPEYREAPPIIWLKKIFASAVELLNGFLGF